MATRKKTLPFNPDLPKPNYVPGTGPSNAQIAIVGEAPGYEENKEGRPFIGSSGRLLSKLLLEAGIKRSEVYTTNVIKYQPPGNDIKRLSEIGITLRSQEENLQNELLTLSPNLILALGNTALTALTGRRGISKYRGSLLQANYGGFKVLPTYHPAALLYNKDRTEKGGRDTTVGGETIVIADLLKAKKNSFNKEFEKSTRILEIIKSEYQLYKFLESYSSKKIVSLDIESNGGIPICIALAFTPYHAVSIPLLPISGLGGGLTLTNTEYISIWKTLSSFLNRPDIQFIGQNFKYDHEKLIAPAKLLSEVSVGKLHADTSLMMGVAYAEFPKNLAFLTSLFTNEPFYKDEGREFNAKKDRAENLLIYNCKDAAVTFEVKNALDEELEEFGSIHKRDLKSFYYNYVNKLHDFYMDIEMEGLDVDLERRNELINSYQKQIEETHTELETLVGHEFNVRSNPTVRRVLVDELNLPARPNYQEDTIVALLGNHTISGSRESKVLGLIIQERQLRTNFNYLKAEVDCDNKIRTSYRIAGTETGRTSTSVLKPPLRPIQSGMAFQTIPKHGPFSSSIRSIFIPPPGYLFLEADLSQAEARIVAILSDDSYTLQLFDTEDIHRVTSSWIFNTDPGNITSDQRFIGKVARHSGNYGTGKRTFMLSVNSLAKKFGLPIQISEKRAQEILDIFHTRTPKIRRVFQSEVKSQVSKDRTLFNPFGRMRQFFGNLKDEELYAQIPQSTVPDQVRHAGLRIKNRLPGIRICAETHDALLFKVPEDKVDSYASVIKQELEVPIDFRSCSLPRGNLVIPAEISVGDRYSELKKVKI